MSIILWCLQIVIAVFCVMGAMWRYSNFDQAAKAVPSIAALPRSTWTIIGAFEVVCAICLVVPGLLGILAVLTPIAALALCVEMLGVSALHMRFFGTKLAATNPAVWTIMLAVLSAIVALARF